MVFPQQKAVADLVLNGAVYIACVRTCQQIVLKEYNALYTDFRYFNHRLYQTPRPRKL